MVMDDLVTAPGQAYVHLIVSTSQEITMTRTFVVTVALALSLAVAPAAFAIPADVNTPNVKAQVALQNGPPTWPANPQPLSAPKSSVVVATTAGDGFDWGSAGIGAAAMAGLVLVALAGVVVVRRAGLRTAQ